MSPTQKRGDASRARLLSATADLLHRQGYSATGLAQILAESGAPKGSLYFYFPGGKEELVAAALRDAGDRLTALLGSLVDAAPTGADAVRAVVAFFRDALEASGYRKGCPVATVALETAGTSDPIQRVCSAIYQSWRDLVAARLARDGMPADRAAPIAQLVLSAIEGALLVSRAHRDTSPLVTTGEELCRLLDPGGTRP